MPKKKVKQAYNIDEEVIIGYNTKKSQDKPKKNNSKKKKKKKSAWGKVKKILILILKILLILAVLAGLFIFLFVSPVFNITNVRVENAEKISENTYLALSQIEIGQNIFSISKSKIKYAIKEESYVEDVVVKREYPGTVVLKVTERKPEYLLEKNGMYVYIDKNGYILETTQEALELPILKGITTDLDKMELGQRIDEEDLSKFNDLIKIINGLESNNISEKLTSIDISDDKNYILEFKGKQKTAILGDTSNLSTKMLWIKYFMEQGTEEAGTIHLDTENIEDTYFEPVRN